MELVERLREIISRLEWRRANHDDLEHLTEAADLLEEALTLLGEIRYSLYPDMHTDIEGKIDAILTKSQGEKIDG